MPGPAQLTSRESALINHAAVNQWITVGGGLDQIHPQTPQKLQDALKAVAERQKLGKSISDNAGVLVEGLKLSIARGQIERAWQAAGGPRSAVGLPLSGALTSVEHRGDLWVGRYRSGEMHLMGNDNVTVVPLTSMTLTLVALECVIKQETNDEIYGTFVAAVPACGDSTPLRVPAKGEATFNSSVRLLFINHVFLNNVAIQDVHLGGALFEHDSGDADKIARDAAAAMQTAAAAALGGLTGAGAEAAAASQSDGQSAGIFQSAADFLVNDVLGMGDDPYFPAELYIRAADMLQGDFPVQTYRRQDDPREVQYTHKMTLENPADGGGDRGVYNAYWRLDVHHMTTD